MTCDRCQRSLVDEDAISTPDGRWLCTPCLEEEARAEGRRDSIDAAWAAVEASVPKGWQLSDLDVFLQPQWPDPDAVALASCHITTASGEQYRQRAIKGKAPTPAAALRAVARQLSDGSS